MRVMDRQRRSSRFSVLYSRRRGSRPVSDQRAYSRREDRLNILIDLPPLDCYRRPMYATGTGSHRRRTERGIERRKQARSHTYPLINHEGVNGVVCLLVAVLLFGGMLALCTWDFAGLSATQRRVNALTESVTAMQAEIDGMAAACEQKVASLNIPVEAAKLGMVSAEKVKTVVLHVREDAVVPPVAQTGYERTETLAAIIGR